MKIKKITALLMAAVLSVSLLAGCGSKTENPGNEDKSSAASQTTASEPGTNAGSEAAEEDKEPDKLTIWVTEKIRVQDWETNAMTLWLEEQGNLDLEFVVIPSSDYETKVSMALTVGDLEDLPDVILGSFSNSTVWEFAQAETILPLTEYYNNPELAVNIMEAYERTGTEYTKQITSPDGNLYGIATLNQSYGSEFPHKMWIYKPWLEALDEDIPTTTEEYYELLKKVSETDLNGNGKADELGLAGDTGGCNGYFHYLMNAFVYAGGGNYRVIEDGKVSSAFITDEWKEGLKYLRKMFEEGLILSESLTMDNTQFKTLLNAEDHTIFSFVCPAPDAAERKEDYVGINTLMGPDGVNYATYNPSAAKVTFLVTANCDNPEAAFRLGDLMSSEYIGISQRFGEEDVHWNYVEDLGDTSGYVPFIEGFDLYIVVYDDSIYWGGSDAQNSGWLQVGPYVRQYGIANGTAYKPEDISTYTANLTKTLTMYQTSGNQPAEVAPLLNYTAQEQDKIADIATSIINYVNESKAAFLSGNLDIDAEWDAYLKEIDKMGLDTWMDVDQVVYDRMYK